MSVNNEHVVGGTQGGRDSERQQVNRTKAPRNRVYPREVDAELPHMLVVARRLTRNAEDAHDLVQDALVRALPASGAIVAATASNLRGWLTTIVRHLHVDRMRRAAREPLAVPIDETRIESVWTNDAASEPGDREPMGMDDVEEALRTLPEVFRRVFVLHEIEGRPYREIAVALDIPMVTVGTRLNRARLKLRVLLSNKRAGRSRASTSGRNPARSDHAM